MHGGQVFHFHIRRKGLQWDSGNFVVCILGIIRDKQIFSLFFVTDLHEYCKTSGVKSPPLQGFCHPGLSSRRTFCWKHIQPSCWHCGRTDLQMTTSMKHSRGWRKPFCLQNSQRGPAAMKRAFLVFTSVQNWEGCHCGNRKQLPKAHLDVFWAKVLPRWILQSHTMQTIKAFMDLLCGFDLLWKLSLW